MFNLLSLLLSGKEIWIRTVIVQADFIDANIDTNINTNIDTKIPGCRECESLSLIPEIRVFYLLCPSYLKYNNHIYSITRFYCVLKLEYPSTFSEKSLRSSEKFGL